MYSMVLLASLATAGDTPSFGKKHHGDCNGNGGCTGAVVVTPAGCTGGYAGCTGATAPKAGFLGICHKKKASAGCTGSVPAPTCCAPVAAPAPVVVTPAPVVMPAPVGCTGGVVYAGCTGGAAPKAGFLGLCHKKKAAGCTGGCTGY